MVHVVEKNPFRGNIHNEYALDGIQMLMGFVSILLNILLLISNYLRKKSRWEVDGLLITITALLDCVIGCYFVIGTAFRLTDPSVVYDSSPWCVFSFTMGRTASVACLNMVALLAMVRYAVIVHQHPPRRWCWTTVAILLLVTCFIVAMLRAHTDTLYVFPSRMYCAPINRHDTAHYKILVNITVWIALPPILIIPFCYISLAVNYVRQVRGLYGGVFPRHGRHPRHVVGMFLIVIAYVAAIIPKLYMLISFFQFENTPSPLFDGISTTSSNFISIINAIFPLLFHEEINPITAGLLESMPSMSQAA
ncbi:hypothetical protein DSO57_1021490 [Entomophthora muscae]|uniref:Uncharacterized protein n=1 Tax=Entomophthora muscae TaxID=34485 RepID=A0ACC2UNT4_9FUNG|nr:hypothetical protein DSO57_1021490 [Entomophthora muscae]